MQLDIYNILGQKVKTLLKQYFGPGEQQAWWDGRNASGSTVASGIYLYRLRADNYSKTRKMIILK